MQWKRKDIPKSRNELDSFVRKNGLTPYGVIGYKGRDIFLAETELETDKPMEHPWGYYQVCWFVTAPQSMEKFDVGNWAEYDSMHDSEAGWTPETKRLNRIQDCVNMACNWIDTSEEAGRYTSSPEILDS